MKSLAMMAMLLMLSNPVWAGGSIEVGGNYESKVRTKDNHNAALGLPDKTFEEWSTAGTGPVTW